MERKTEDTGTATIEQDAATRGERAIAWFKDKGANCAQAVFLPFAKDIGLDETMALRLSSSFGGGMGRLREVCGAVTGAFMAAGALYGYSDLADPARKAAQYALVQQLAREFAARHGGTYLCRELLANADATPKEERATGATPPASAPPTPSPVPTPRTPAFYHARPCAAFVRDAADMLDRYAAIRADLTRFLSPDGKLKTFPAKQKPREAAIRYLALLFVPGRDYVEKEVNQILTDAHLFNDYFILRRELVESHYVLRTRDGARYWRNPEMAPLG